MTEIDILFEDPRWEAAGLSGLAHLAIPATLEALAIDPGASVSILACDDTRIAVLNAEFRDKSAATNVLSWPSEDLASGPGARPALPTDPELGDIAIAYDTCIREAAEQGKTRDTHVLHLLVHATLHLLGYDHIEDADARIMEHLERQILAKLGRPDPYEG